MARSSLSKSSKKLNLSQRQILVYQKVISAGNRMSDALRDFHKRGVLDKEDAAALATGWGDLMVELVKLLL